MQKKDPPESFITFDWLLSSWSKQLVGTMLEKQANALISSFYNRELDFSTDT